MVDALWMVYHPDEGNIRVDICASKGFYWIYKVPNATDMKKL